MDTATRHISDAIKALFDSDVRPNIERPDPQFGDAATNIALQLAKPLGKNPREIAEQIAESLRLSDDFTSVEIAGPGFINLRFSDRVLISQLQTRPVYGQPETFVIEYSCPNAFKELHTGHLYNTILGDILARLVEQSGNTVHRTSFGGDVGLHVAKALWGMVATLGKIDPALLSTVDQTAFGRASWISQCYVKGAGEYEENIEAKQEIDELNKTIYGFHNDDDHDSPLAQIYWATRQWSYDYFAAFYDLLHVDTMRYYPESETAPTGMKVVSEQLEKGILKESEGAIVFEGDESKHLHTRVFVTSKGLPTYETKDIGVIWREQADYRFDRRVLITGNDQKEYMRVVFAAADAFQPGIAEKMIHLTNGTVRFGDGKKMSSRLGNVSRAVDVIDVVREKVAELVSDASLVEPVTLGAIKYVFAKYRLGGDIAFDIDETVSLAGNSGPYIQYAHARARSIIRKSTKAGDDILIDSLDEHERALAAKLAEYHEVVSRARDELLPHYICHYLYELAQTFNRFYERARVVGSDREAERIALVKTYADVLESGLSLLGIAAPDTM
jgi:arginyl-tRNA synthetase